MGDGDHDYSRHTEADLREQIASIDPAKFPLRSRSLMLELYRRMLASEEGSRAASAAVATAGRGARFDELDSSSVRRFFWPFFWFSVIFYLVVAVTLSLGISAIAGVVDAFGDQPSQASELTFRVVQIIVSVVVAVPLTRLWLRQITKRSFGKFGLRVVRPVDVDVA
jgi:hypothetical protein